MKTLLANLKHAARNGYTTHIGGGVFRPIELKRATVQIERQTQALEWITNHPEAHADELRALALSTLQETTQ